MLKKLKIFLILFTICSCQIISAQEKPVKKDSLRGYRSIEAYSKKRGFTKFLHKLIFKSVDSKKPKNKKQDKVVLKDYVKVEGKIVRNIHITTLDPFGFSEKDSTRKARNGFERFGNRVHIKSAKLTIKNLLLIKRNKPLDSLLVKESERLIRSQRYVRAVDIRTEVASSSSDSVDVYIRVLDSWSLIPNAAGSTSRTTFELTERNFLGSGHEWDNTYRQSFNDGRSAYSTRYTVPNIMNTYIKTSLAYSYDAERNMSKSINIDRPFFSPFAKWGAGIYVAQDYRRDSLPDNIGKLAMQSYKFGTQDVWVGKSLQIFEGDSEEDRTTSFITSLRFLRKNFVEQPQTAYDTLNYYSDENFFLTGFGVSSRKYIQDKYLFNYGITEDVAIGKVYAMTLGYQNKNHINRMYFGGRFAYGQYFKWGYFSTNVEYGTFFRGPITEQTTFSLEVNYFTNLINLGEWRIRQFVKPKVVIGTNRYETIADRIDINEDNGIPGFRSYYLRGTKKMQLMLQTQSYSPWNLGGFRINPFLNATISMISGNNDNLWKGKAYSQVGVGIMISNDFLVFNNFQFSFSYYPSIPETGDNVIQTNSLKNNDYTLPNYEFGKPEIVPYK
ncbi:hypothetical protein [uncultured Flavobacterium sp.]|uniref:hypothetical protein n=1 Tax=uncultured Flavobacterium sp. TaxID=165435 RepID=UPI0025FB8172|nr:hypothetical protein [uncultured Flavobacterium sp.]